MVTETVVLLDVVVIASCTITVSPVRVESSPAVGIELTVRAVITVSVWFADRTVKGFVAVVLC